MIHEFPYVTSNRRSCRSTSKQYVYYGTNHFFFVNLYLKKFVDEVESYNSKNAHHAVDIVETSRAAINRKLKRQAAPFLAVRRWSCKTTISFFSFETILILASPTRARYETEESEKRFVHRSLYIYFHHLFVQIIFFSFPRSEATPSTVYVLEPLWDKDVRMFISFSMFFSNNNNISKFLLVQVT